MIRIGFQEEILGGRYRYPWILSSIPYSLVHTITLNPVLVAAALVVGLILGHLAHRYGVGASGIAHVLWIYLIILVHPLV